MSQDDAEQWLGASTVTSLMHTSLQEILGFCFPAGKMLWLVQGCGFVMNVGLCLPAVTVH
jgi:hypothetical protein